MKISKKIIAVVQSQNTLLVLVVLIVFLLFYIGTKTQYSPVQPKITPQGIYLTPEPSPTIPIVTPGKSNAWTKKTVVHTADLSNAALLTYTYMYKNNYSDSGEMSRRGFSISYPAKWDFVITTNGWGNDNADARDTITISSNDNQLIIFQPIEGMGCYYFPGPTGYGGYYTNYSDIRTIDGKVWRRSKVDNGQYGSVPNEKSNDTINYIICEGVNGEFSDTNILGGIYYKVPNNDPAIVSQMDDMVRSITLVR